MKMWKSVVLAVALVISLLAAPGSHAQSLQNGAVRGTVYDTSHSVVPGAKVILSNPSTGFSREQSVGADGFYSFDNVPPGVYKLHAEADGFAASEITDIHVEVGSSLVLDSTLPVKGQTQTVTVTAEAVGAVDTSTAGINQVINQKDLESLPLSGRDYRDLAELSSSAQVVPGLRGGIRLGGQQSDYLGMVIDGQDSFNNFFGEIFGSLETKNFTIPLDAVQEFQVVTNGFAPEFGRATGGLVNVVTKSGTNDLHGEAHEYYRGGSLTAEDALNNPSNISNQNQFGGSVGFPIVKDKQFLFLAADIQRENGPLVTNLCGSGTVADCNTFLSTANGSGGPVTGPVFAACNAPAFLGGDCLPGQVPLPSGTGAQGLFLPAACNQSPAAGDSVLQDCYGVSALSDFNGPHNQFQNLSTVLGHYDFQISPANHFSNRTYWTRNHTSGFTGGLGQNETPSAFGSSENFINQGISSIFSLNTVLGRKVNEIRVSFARETRNRDANGPGQPTLLVGSQFGPMLAGQRYYLPITGTNSKLQVGDSFSYSFGKHDMKFGGDVDTFRDSNDSFVGWSAGSFAFNSLADFQNANITGVPYNQAVGLNSVPLFQAGTLKPNYQTGVGIYWQDKWQVTSRITLTYGLRWDGTWNPQPQTPTPGVEVYAGVGAGTHTIPVPQHVPNDFKQFGPRIGLAWNVGSLQSPTIVRAAWGFYYAQAPLIFLPTAGGGKTAGIFCFGAYCYPPAGFPYIFPSSIPGGVDSLCSNAAIGCPGPNIVDPSFQNPRVSNLTGSIEHTFAHDWTVTATFVWVDSQHLRTGGYGTEEAWQRNFTQCPGGANAPPMVDNVGRSILCGNLDTTLSPFTNWTGSFAHGNYESGVINITKRFSNNFQVFANYIWSQNKDNGASERDTDTYFGQQDPFNINLDYGRNGLDIKHQFKAAGVYDLPHGFSISSSLIAHTGVPYPIYVNVDVNGDLVADSTYAHNNDRPTILVNGKTKLLGRYPLNQPGFAEWDMRLQKDLGIHEQRYHLQLSGDFFNLTNRGNVYSNPDTTATIDYQTLGACVPWASIPAYASSGAMGSSCSPLTALPALDVNGLPLRRITQVAPGSTPFAFQAGAKFIF
ncbi:MAG: carboxypeptidase regulatory-like domain-containing protein [Candidatus Acidiferrales bacterium]